MSGTANVPGQELEQQQQQSKLVKGAIVSASSSAATVWAGLTEVERTSLLVAFARWQGSQQHVWPDGRPWYTDPLGVHFVRSCIPNEQQQRFLDWAEQRAKISHFVAVRTAELDAQIAIALENSSSIQQMVLLGSGTDTRAWRLPWPPGFRVFEVDSPAVLAFKARVLSGAAAAAADGEQQQQQQQGEAAPQPQLQCEQRVEVPADASQPEELWTSLVSSGLDASCPVLWLLEGFIGYLTVSASNALLSHLASKSAPGSCILITAPPTPDRLGEAAAADDEAAAAATKDSAPAAAAGDIEAAAAAAAAAASHVTAPKLKLHHSTYEEPTETLSRVAAAGWRNCQLLTEQQLAAKYGVEHAQPILVASV